MNARAAIEAAPDPLSGTVAAAAALVDPPAWIEAAEARGWTWAGLNWRRAAAQPGAWFDHAKADAVVEAWPRWFKLTEDRFYNRPFRLALWQEIIVRLLVGWKIPDESIDPETGRASQGFVRLFRRLKLWVPRKAGKTEFLSALGLLFFYFERVHGAEGFVFAVDEKQAGKPFGKMQTMIALNPALAKETQTFKKSIFVPAIQGAIRLLAGGAFKGKHGFSPTMVLGDEMHEWASTEIADTLRQGMGARLQPIELYASTAGLKTNPIGMQLFDETAAALDGRSNDTETLAVIFAADPDDDPFDEATWQKANPNLGVTPTLRFLRSEAELARNNPRKLAQFKCYHLGQWIDAEVAWLPLKKWDLCAPVKNWRERLEAFASRQVIGAFDVSSTQDITALVWRSVAPDTGRIEIAARFWIPEDTLARRAELDRRTPWRQWVDMGAIETTPGDAVDQDFVKRAIYDGLEAYQVEKIGFDSWNARKLHGDMCKERGLDEILIEIRQGIHSLGEASKEYERRVFDGSYDHGGHPVLRWMAGHCAIRFDENLNFMPAKKRSREKIDAIAAGVMAEALAMPSEPKTFVAGFLEI